MQRGLSFLYLKTKNLREMRKSQHDELGIGTISLPYDLTASDIVKAKINGA